MYSLRKGEGLGEGLEGGPAESRVGSIHSQVSGEQVMAHLTVGTETLAEKVPWP